MMSVVARQYAQKLPKSWHVSSEEGEGNANATLIESFAPIDWLELERVCCEIAVETEDQGCSARGLPRREDRHEVG